MEAHEDRLGSPVPTPERPSSREEDSRGPLREREEDRRGPLRDKEEDRRGSLLDRVYSDSEDERDYQVCDDR